MTTVLDQDVWQAAFNRNERRVLNHPRYPTLYRKVARAEAAGRKPIAYRYRAGKHDFTIRWPEGPLTMTPRWQQTLITHPGCGPSEPLRDAWKYAEEMIPEIFDEEWPSRGDMAAAIYGAAMSEVRARRAPGRR